MQVVVCGEVPVRDYFLVMRNLKVQRIRIRIRIQRSCLSWGLKKRRLLGTICTLRLGTRLLQEQLNRDLEEIEDIAMVYKL